MISFELISIIIIQLYSYMCDVFSQADDVHEREKRSSSDEVGITAAQKKWSTEHPRVACDWNGE